MAAILKRVCEWERLLWIFEWWKYEASIMTIISTSCWALHNYSFCSCCLSLICASEGASAFKFSLSLTYGNELGCTGVSPVTIKYIWLLWFFIFLLQKAFFPHFLLYFILFICHLKRAGMMGPWEKKRGPNYFCSFASFTSLIEWVSRTRSVSIF